MIGILNLENLPNFALEKVKAFYGKDAENYRGVLFNDEYEKVYVSSLFSWTEKPKQYKNWIVGGTGYNIQSKLPDEIEKVKPKVNFGFTTRGCINHCKFCLVREKEGYFNIVGDLLDLWDGKAKEVILLDNNPSADKDHFKLIAKQAQYNNIKINFYNFDFRELDDDICKTLNTFKHDALRLAFDDIKYKNKVIEAIKLLQKYNIDRNTWYVLVGFNSTFEEDLERLSILKENNQNAYVMIYNKYEHPDRSKYTNLQRWANQHHIFQGMSYNEFLKVNKKYYETRTVL